MDTTHDDLCRTEAGKYGVICLCDLILQAEQRGREQQAREDSGHTLRAIRAAVQRERKAAAERVLGALDTERIKWQYRVDTSDGEESMIGRRYIDYVEAMERAIELAAAALGEGG